MQRTSGSFACHVSYEAFNGQDGYARGLSQQDRNTEVYEDFLFSTRRHTRQYVRDTVIRKRWSSALQHQIYQKFWSNRE